MTTTPPVRVAVIGAGFWAATNHIPVLASRDDVELVSVCSHGPELDEVAEEFGIPLATTDPMEALDAGVDAVVVAVPNMLHYPISVAALDRGMHLLVEKPLATTAVDAWDLVRRADKAGVIALVPHGWHYKGFVEEAFHAMRAGQIGEVESFLCHMASPTIDLFDGVGSYGSAEMHGHVIETDPSTWADPSRGGGYALGQLTHALGLLFWLVDCDPVEVYGRTRPSITGVDAFDSGVLTLANGAIGSLSGAGHLPAGSRFQVDIRIFGSEGVLLLDVERERCAVVRRDGTETHAAVTPGEGDYTCVEPVNRFIDLIRGTSSFNQSPLECAARAVTVSTGLLESSRQAAPVALSRGVTP